MVPVCWCQDFLYHNSILNTIKMTKSDKLTVKKCHVFKNRTTSRNARRKPKEYTFIVSLNSLESRLFENKCKTNENKFLGWRVSETENDTIGFALSRTGYLISGQNRKVSFLYKLTLSQQLSGLDTELYWITGFILKLLQN